MEQKKKQSSLRVGYKSENTLKNNLGEVLGKIPPQAIDLEEAVLGALMLEKDALSNVIEVLKPESFYRESHAEIFRAIVELFNNTEPVDLLTVTNRLRKNGKLDFVAGSAHSTLTAFADWQGAKLVGALAQGMYWILVLRADLNVERGDIEAVKGLSIGAAPGVDLGLRGLLTAAGMHACPPRSNGTARLLIPDLKILP